LTTGAGARGELLCLGRQYSRAKWPIFPQLMHGKLLVGNCYGSLLRRWSRGTVELLLLLLELLRVELWVIAPILLSLLSMQLTLRWGIHDVVLGRSTARTTTASGSRHHTLPLFLLSLSNGLHHPLLFDGCTCQLIVRQAREMHQALLQMDGEPYTIQVGHLFICVNVV
jgi:hypothetical protein